MQNFIIRVAKENMFLCVLERGKGSLQLSVTVGFPTENQHLSLLWRSFTFGTKGWKIQYSELLQKWGLSSVNTSGSKKEETFVTCIRLPPISGLFYWTKVMANLSNEAQTQKIRGTLLFLFNSYLVILAVKWPLSHVLGKGDNIVNCLWHHLSCSPLVTIDARWLW